MRKKILSILIIILIIAACCAFILGGCDKTREVTDIRVDTTEIFMAPYGEPSQFKINASVLPVNAKNQAVYYRYEDAADRQFISIDANGLIKARAIKNVVSKDEYDEDVYTPVPIFLFVHSRDNPNVSVKISVIVEEVAVKRIYFRQSENKIFFEDSATLIRPQVVEPVVEPAHAIIGRELTYVIKDSDVLDIFVTKDKIAAEIIPKKIGATLVTVNTRPVGAFDAPLQAHAVFQVVYAALHYEIKLDSPIAFLNQVQGESSKIEFSLIQTSPKSDPNPDISWYVNDTPINQEGARNSVKLVYELKNLPPGNYNIKAILSNANEEKTLISEQIRVYQPLKELRLGVLNELIQIVEGKGNAEKGDVLRVAINKKDSEYPPEAYKWSITKPNNEIEYIQTAPKATTQVGGIKIADLNYTLKEEGIYKINVQPIVKGAPREVIVNSIQIQAAGEDAGNDLSRILVEGKPINEQKTSYLPYITWKGLPYTHDEMAIEVRKQVGADYTIQTLLLSQNPQMYDGHGIFIPEDVARLDENFAVRIKGDRYGWTNWYEYTSRLAINQYSYFDVVYQNQNRYISNVEDLAWLLNELVIFRPLPEDLPAGMARWGAIGEEGFAGKIVYTFDFYSPYRLTQAESIYYRESDNLYEENSNKKVFSDMFIVALHTYAETTPVSLSVDTATPTGEYKVSFAFPNLVQTFKTKEEPATPKLNNDLFNKTGAEPSATLPIDLLTERSVSTTNQLFLAAITGYKPVPVVGSAAEKAYKVARYIIKNNITVNMTDEEKVLAIYDFITKNTSYDYELATHNDVAEDPISSYDGFQIEGVFKGDFNSAGDVVGLFAGKGVCDGISKATSLLLSMLGFANTRQVGNDISSGVAHVWNLLLVDGKYYVVDATWGIRNLRINAVNHEFVSHKFLLTTLEEAYGFGRDNPAMHVYGKYSELAEKPLYSGYKYPIHVTSTNQVYDKFIETSEEFEYLITEHLKSKLIGEITSIVCDFAFRLDNPVEGNYIFDLYTQSDSSAIKTYDEFIKENRHMGEISSIINQFAASLDGISITTLAVTSAARNNVMAVRLFFE